MPQCEATNLAEQVLGWQGVAPTSVHLRIKVYRSQRRKRFHCRKEQKTDESEEERARRLTQKRKRRQRVKL